MKCVLAISGLTIALVACSPTDPCRSHSDEASCVADKACQWKTKKEYAWCKPVKENTSSQEQATYANSGAFGAASGTLNRSAHARTFAYRTSGPK